MTLLNIDLPMFLSIGLSFILLYSLSVSGFLKRSLRYSLLLGYFALDLGGNFSLLTFQLRAVPNILHNLFVTKTGYLNYLIRLIFATLFLVPRMLSHHPLLYVTINITMLSYIVILNSFPRILIVLYLIEVITGYISLRYIAVFSEDQFITFLGGPDVFFFFEETTVLSFFKD
jgi:hypothetical protein